MIEGGAVDWANHSRQPSRMIEEQIDFFQAAEAVIEWVNARSNWQETLLILTADHETGLLWGPTSDSSAFEPLADRGLGVVPGLKYNHNSHTNSLVPLYARGPGSQRFAALAAGTDETAAAKWSVSSRYVENTSIFAVANAECDETQ